MDLLNPNTLSRTLSEGILVLFWPVEILVILHQNWTLRHRLDTKFCDFDPELDASPQSVPRVFWTVYRVLWTVCRVFLECSRLLLLLI